ncbi:hypothetical protein [Pimelobacter sp. 30-1]|uniref:hypothetical protein n=1 Tax=Pimelobacter TaxID=2044 RepID=UPI001C05D80A|nr:hypothetical protein [Pimelobacter sp. 30-1]MBU2696322.1 hypothetical protein [Pimelobacter sp. 30-1]
MLTVRRTPRRRVAVPALLGSLESVTALVLAHVAAGGEVPALWWLGLVALLVYGAGSLVLHQRASIRVMLPVLVAVQLLGHAWLVALSPGMHGHEHAMAAFLGLTPAMLAAHLVAALVTGAMWSLRRRAVEVLLGWTDPGRLPVPRLRPQRVVRVVVVRARRGHRALAPTRGPPVAATVALV